MMLGVREKSELNLTQWHQSEMVRSQITDSWGQMLLFKSQLCHLWPYSSYLTTLHLSFLFSINFIFAVIIK